MRDVLIAGAVRTPIGDINGRLAAVTAVGLGKAAAAESLRRAGLEPARVDEAVFGNVLQAGQGQNPARQVAIGVGIPVEAPALTVNMVCGSGLKALELGWQSIRLGRADRVLAGGIESMSHAPFILPALRGGARLGHATALDTVVSDGLTDAFHHVHMGLTAERLADEFKIGREEQDRFAVESHRRYAAALAAGRPAAEIAPVRIPGRKGDTVVEADEHPRPDASLEKLAGLRAAFKEGGTVTAGNASGINDGAAAVVLVAADAPEAAAARAAGAFVLRDVAACGCEPQRMGLGPVGAVRKLLAAAGLGVADIDLWELNEAFAVQALAVLRELGPDPARVNVNGGAIALGHPIGASGARIVVSLMHEMTRRGARRGVAALCIGGGMGLAALIESR